jgi:hypothetical protein
MDNTIEYFIKTNYNLFPTARSGRYRCICPFCNNSKQKFYFDFALGFYKCFHCNNYGKLPYFIYLRHSQEKNLYYNAVNYYKNSKQSKFPMSLPADFKFLKGNTSNIAKEYILYFLSRGIPLNILLLYPIN